MAERGFLEQPRKNADHGITRAREAAMSRVSDAERRELAERRRGAVTLVDSTVDQR